MYPLKKGKTAEQAHVGLPEGTYEEEHGRRGFYGKSAHLYHTHPPTAWIRFEGKLRPHCIDCNKLRPTDMTDPKGSPVAFLGNADVRLFVSRRSAPMPFYVRNADGDELYFIHRGKGVIETDFGPLTFEPGDYIVLPRAVTYRVLPETTDNFFLIIESKTEFDQPEKGLIGQHALYDPSVIVTPEPAPNPDDTGEWEIRIKSGDEFSSVVYPFNPLDVVGWKGDLTAWKINLRDIRPVMSHRAHLPPSAHTTFVTAGAVVCSFVPRPSRRTRRPCASPSSTGTPITTNSFSTTTAIFSAATTSRPGWSRSTRAAYTTDPTPKPSRARKTKPTPTNTP